MAKYFKFAPMEKWFGYAVVAIVAVTVVSASGLLNAPTQLLGRAFGSVKAAVRSALGLERRA